MSQAHDQRSKGVMLVCPLCGMGFDVACRWHGVVEPVERSVYVTFVSTGTSTENPARDQHISATTEDEHPS